MVVLLSFPFVDFVFACVIGTFDLRVGLLLFGCLFCFERCLLVVSLFALT